MTTAIDDDARRAQDKVRRAVIGIITRGRDGDADPEYVALEIDNVYAGHGYAYQPAPSAGLEYCPVHTTVKKPCGMCPKITAKDYDDA